MSRRFDLLTIGRCSMDLFAEQIGAPFPAIESFAAQVGGSPTNIAIAASRLGLRAAVMTAVGRDPVGAYVRASLARDGVDTAFVHDKPGRTCLAVVGVQPPDRFPLVFYREAAPDRHLDGADAARLPFADITTLLVAGSNLAAPALREATLTALELGRQHGCATAIDLDCRPHLWPAARTYARGVAAVWPLCDVVIGTEEEMWLALADASADASADVWGGAAVPVAQRAALADLIAARRRPEQTVVLKRGGRGATVFTDDADRTDGTGQDVAGFPVTVLNTVGAGDAFAAGLLTRRHEGAPWAEAVRFANACGAIVVTRHGCSAAMPRRAEVAAWNHKQRHE